MSIEYWEWEELAAHLLGKAELEDSEEIENLLYNKYGVDTESFAILASDLLNMTAPMRTAITNTLVQAFVVNDEHGTRAVVKQEFKL